MPGREKKGRGRLVRGGILALALCGAGLMLRPLAGNWFSQRLAGQEIARYNHVALAESANYASEWASAEEYNRRLAQAGGLAGASAEPALQDVSGLLNPLGTGMMGYLDIPKIDVHLPIYQGTQERALQAGAGFWIGTSLPTGGPGTHCVLTAHSGLAKAKMFTDLDQMEQGDLFTLSILDRTLTYEVDDVRVVLPDDLRPLEIQEGEDYVTLYTCTPYGINTHRLLVRGRRVLPSGTPGSEPGTDGAHTGWLHPGAAVGAVLVSTLAAAGVRAAVQMHRKRRAPTADRADKGASSPHEQT